MIIKLLFKEKIFKTCAFKYNINIDYGSLRHIEIIFKPKYSSFILLFYYKITNYKYYNIIIMW